MHAGPNVRITAGLAYILPQFGVASTCLSIKEINGESRVEVGHMN